MLTISISEALQGPAAWSEWDAADAEAAASAEAWQQQATEWGLQAIVGESNFPLGDLSDPWHTTWPMDARLIDAGLQPAWSQEHIASEAAASMALVAAMQSCSLGAPTPVCAPTLPSDVQGREAAMASPLFLPLPAPFAVEPISELEELELEGLDEEIDVPPVQIRPSEPQKIAAPPSLLGHSGPGSFVPKASPSTAAAAPMLSQKPAVNAAEAPVGMSIRPGEVCGQACTCVDWKIDDFSGKLQASMGRPVVSPAFSASGLSNLRLMVFPDARDAVKRARGFERKALYANMVKQGPLYGSLKLKADGLERATVMTFSLLVGGVRSGPSTYDFSEQAVLGLDDFGIDWLQQVEKASGAIHVGIEIIEVRQK